MPTNPPRSKSRPAYLKKLRLERTCIVSCPRKKKSAEQSRTSRIPKIALAFPMRMSLYFILLLLGPQPPAVLEYSCSFQSTPCLRADSFHLMAQLSYDRKAAWCPKNIQENLKQKQSLLCLQQRVYLRYLTTLQGFAPASPAHEPLRAHRRLFSTPPFHDSLRSFRPLILLTKTHSPRS